MIRPKDQERKSPTCDEPHDHARTRATRLKQRNTRPRAHSKAPTRHKGPTTKALNTQNGRAENRIPHTCLPRSARRATHTHRRSKSTTYHYPLHRNPSGPDRASSRAQLVGRGCTRPFARRTRSPLRHTWNYHAGEEYGKRCRRSLTVASASAAHRARSPPHSLTHWTRRRRRWQLQN